MEATERDERGKREEIEKGKEEQGGRARSCVLGARAPWTERGSLSSWLLPEDDGILVGCFGCRREKWLGVVDELLAQLEAGKDD